jgi:hypothetical protein
MYTGVAKARDGLVWGSANECLHFIVFSKEVEMGAELLAESTTPSTRLVLVSLATPWHLTDFLSSPLAKLFPNLVLLSDSFSHQDMVAKCVILHTLT